MRRRHLSAFAAADACVAVVELPTAGAATGTLGYTDRLRVQSRTFDLRVNAHCGKAAASATAHLYIGGPLG